jgi:hypothetical protein
MNEFSFANKVNIPKLLWFIFFVVFTPLFILSYLATVPAEDAVILYEYAKNLALNGIVTYGGSTIPIEGATDFAWMVAIALLKWIGIDEFASALFLNFLGLIFVGSLFKGAQQKIVVGIAILFTPYLYASLNGFSAIFFSALYLLTLKLLIDKSRHLYLSLLILCLVRPDGVVWSAGCVMLRLLQVSNKNQLNEEVKKCALWLIAPGLIYFIWRFWYFQEVFPLPFIVKATSTRDLLIFYKDSIDSVLLVSAPLVFTLVAFARNRKDLLQFLILLGMPIVFYSAMRLEQNIGNRFMAPLFFGGLFLVCQKFGQRALILFIFISIFTQVKMAAGTAAGVADSARETVYYLSKDLSALNGRMLITEAGRLTYYSNWFSEDSWGLNTPRYAHALISKSEIKAGKYDLIVAHCELSMLNVGSNLGHDESRTWNNQCKTLVSHIIEEQFDIYLVPFDKDGPSFKDHLKLMLGRKKDVEKMPLACIRHDIYAVSKQYSHSDKLITMLQKHGAKIYSGKILTSGDAVCDTLK